VPSEAVAVVRTGGSAVPDTAVDLPLSQLGAAWMFAVNYSDDDHNRSSGTTTADRCDLGASAVGLHQSSYQYMQCRYTEYAPKRSWPTCSEDQFVHALTREEVTTIPLSPGCCAAEYAPLDKVFKAVSYKAG
jgi:hypothetical protein